MSVCLFPSRRVLPSTRPSSPSPTCFPNAASDPLHVTRPASINLSASRREQTPVSLMYLLSLTKVDLTNGGAWLRLEESADLLRQRLGSGVEHVGVVLSEVYESCLGQDRLGP